MQTKLKQEFHQQEFAKWTNKGKNIEINNQVKQRLASLRQSAALNLASRRYSLHHKGNPLRYFSLLRIRPTARKSWLCKRRLNRHVSEWRSV
jgi:DNA-binding transcriptional regulator WhiA